MTNKNQPLPSLTPERDQVEAFHTDRKTKARKPAPQPSGGGGGSTFATVMIFLLIIALGVGGWWFDMQNKTMQAQIIAAEARIQELETKLSATGEEMGESAVVLRTKLTDLTERTEELWKQMDKLWASAWRRNQADIKAVQTQLSQQSKTIGNLSKQNKTTSDTIKSVANKQTETDFNLGILSEQLEAARNLSSDLEAIKSRLSQLETGTINKDQQQIELAGNVAEVERQLNQIISRLSRLENQPSPSTP